MRRGGFTLGAADERERHAGDRGEGSKWIGDRGGWVGGVSDEMERREGELEGRLMGWRGERVDLGGPFYTSERPRDYWAGRMP